MICLQPTQRFQNIKSSKIPNLFLSYLAKSDHCVSVKLWLERGYWSIHALTNSSEKWDNIMFEVTPVDLRNILQENEILCIFAKELKLQTCMIIVWYAGNGFCSYLVTITVTITDVSFLGTRTTWSLKRKKNMAFDSQGFMNLPFSKNTSPLFTFVWSFWSFLSASV